MISVHGKENNCKMQNNTHKKENIGIRKGCKISPVLFFLYIQGGFNKVKKVSNKEITVHKETVNLLLFANDIAVVAESQLK